MKTSTSLTSRELQILHMIAFEANMHEIADRLFISHHTVVSHRKRLIQKLKVKNTAGLIRRAFELGILQVVSSAA
jgi:DNA-binding CsgD family transcriptional regulator